MPIISAYQIDRGRSSELERTDAGTASITMIDTNGSLDPAGGGSTYAPMTPVAIALGGAPIFVGHVARWSYDLYPTMDYATATIDCVDAIEIFSATEMFPDPTLWGDDPVPPGSLGNIRYAADTQVKHRIDHALNQIGWPAGNREVFTGNVALRPTVYAPRQSAINVINDAADAELPGVANFYIQKDGKATFHGRLARFNPTDAQYHITTWNCGDLANSSGRAVIFGLEYDQDKERIINSAYCAPEGINDDDLEFQYVQDDASIAAYGTRSWSAENLIIDHSYLTGNSAMDECRDVYAQYYVTNYAQPQTQVTSLRFRWLPPTNALASRVNALMSGIDISDRIHLLTSNGFNQYYFVEGLHYTAAPATDTYLDVTLDVDLSPAANWTTLPS